MNTKRKLNKTNALILMLVLIALGLLSFFMYNHFITRYPKSLLEKNIPEQENDTTYKISKSKVNEHYFVFHYPDTKAKALNRWIKEIEEETIEKYQDAFSDEESHEIKQEYDAYESGKQFISVKLTTFVDGKNVQTVSRTYDKKTKEFVNPTLFNAKAKRFMTHQLRENQDVKIDRQDFLAQTEVQDDFENIYLKNHEITLIHPYKTLTFDLKENASFLNEDFLDIKKGKEEDVPSVYLDYGHTKDEKLIAITFDDGPYTVNALKIMDIFDKYNAQATFFLLGQRIPGQEETVKAMIDRGHQVASHSESHPSFTSLSPKEIIEELDQTEKYVADATGYREKLFVRPPYGAITRELLDELDYVFVNWSVDTEDWLNRNANTVCDISLQYTYDGAILLMHELYDSTVDSLECVLSSLSKQGYKFVTVKELFEAKELDYKTGDLYFDGL